MYVRVHIIVTVRYGDEHFAPSNNAFIVYGFFHKNHKYFYI